MTETAPRVADETPAPETGAPPAAAGLAGIVGTVDHKVVGRLFIVTSLLFGIVAVALFELFAIDRIDGKVGNTVLNADTYYQVFTLQAVAGTLLFAVPLLLGIAMVVVPLQIGSRSIAFPRAAAASFWSFLVSGGLVVASYVMNGGPGGGSSKGVELWTASMMALVASLLLATLCVVATVLALRTPGMTLARTPLFSWSMLVAGGVWLLSLPVLIASLLLLYVGHRYGGRGFVFGDNAEMFTHVRWALNQPQIYAFAAPVLGFACDVATTATRGRLVLHRLAMAGIGAFAVFGFGGYLATFDNPEVTTQPLYIFAAFAAVIAAVLVGGIIAETLRQGSIKLSSPLVFAGAAYLMLLTGVVAGAASTIDAFDLAGTVWNDGVTHYVLLAAVIAGFGGLHHWATKIGGRPLKDGPGYLAALALLGGTVLVGLPDLISGAFGKGKEDLTGIEFFNAIIAIGGALALLGGLIAVVNVLGGLRGPDDHPADPWDGGTTLEWATASPPPVENFDDPIAEVTSEAPLLDAREAQEATA